MAMDYTYIIGNGFLVLAVMFALFYFLKKLRVSKQINNNLINVVQVVSIGTKEKLVLVEANNSFILLGATANHIETLHIFDQELSQDNQKENNDNERTFSFKFSKENQIE